MAQLLNMIHDETLDALSLHLPKGYVLPEPTRGNGPLSLEVCQTTDLQESIELVQASCPRRD